MEVIWREVGDFTVRITCQDDAAARLVHRMFGHRPAPERVDTTDYYQLNMRQGCGPNTEGLDTAVTESGEGGWLFERPDYRLELSPDYRNAEIEFYNYIGLRCVMMNWFSAVAALRRWGLVIHSSCVIHNGEAYLFAGYSGAGKTTVASLSHPRGLLSDEATLVKLSADGRPAVYDSPMRSSLLQPAPVKRVPLKAVYFLEQSNEIRTQEISGSRAFIYMLDKIWFWPHQPALSAEVVRLCKKLAESVPMYGLEFQKNDLFWEAIS